MSNPRKFVLVDIDDGVATVTLNRPEVMNAINLALREEVIQLAAELDADKNVRAVVLTGAGDKSFCVGADLKERQEKTVEEMYHFRRYVNPRWVSAIANITKPTIAAVNGYCLAGGVELVLQCDLAIASDTAVFGIPEVSLGFLPGAGACQRLPRAIGFSKAKELILTGRRFGAAEAERIGLVTRVVPQAQVLRESLALARSIAANPSMSVIQAKIAVNASQETLLAAGLRFENEAWLSCMLSDAWKGKLKDFVAK
ncbi:MAG: enoyl-CoA hydratase/isomerase family protein [Betaproteobacteria bacterium]|nr:enoyl-CoA hydratase/isomerase family protein [Betaproteobacteria bacterium]